MIDNTLIDDLIGKLMSYEGECPINPQEFTHIVYVGRKGVMQYVMAVRHHFEMDGADKVLITARGRAISRAVDVAEAVVNRILKGRVKKGKIETCTEVLKDEETGRERRISSIYIVLEKA